MKRWIKGMLIGAGVCVATGTLVCVVAWAMGGRFSHYRYRRYGFTVGDNRIEEDIQREEALIEEAVEYSVEKAHHADDHWEEDIQSDRFNQTEINLGGQLSIDGQPIRELEIKVAGLYVEVVPDETIDEMKIVINDDDNRCDQMVDDDTLKLSAYRAKSESRMFPDFDGSEEVGVEIRIPAGCKFQDVELEVAGGRLSAYGMMADSMELELKAGLLEVADSSVRELQGDCKAGELLYGGNVAWKMEADCSAGVIGYELAGREEDFYYELEKEMGSILINGIERQFHEKTVVNNPGAGKEAELECKVGEIRVDFIG